MKLRETQKGQAILEYILLVVMIAVTVAVTIRNTNRTIYSFWTGLALNVATPCPDCKAPPPPILPGGAAGAGPGDPNLDF